MKSMVMKTVSGSSKYLLVCYTDHTGLEHHECGYNFKVNYHSKSFNRQFMGEKSQTFTEIRSSTMSRGYNMTRETTQVTLETT